METRELIKERDYLDGLMKSVDPYDYNTHRDIVRRLADINKKLGVR